MCASHASSGRVRTDGGLHRTTSPKPGDRRAVGSSGCVHVGAYAAGWIESGEQTFGTGLSFGVVHLNHSSFDLAVVEVDAGMLE